MNELPRINRWITEVLTDDPATAAIIDGRIYHDQAPEDASYPFIVFSFSDGEAVNGLGACRLMTRARYQIKVVARDVLDANARTLADRIDAVIGTAQAATHSADSSIAFSARLESPIAYSEPSRDSSRVFRHLGGLYLIEAY